MRGRALLLVVFLSGCLGASDEIATNDSVALVDAPVLPPTSTYYDVAPRDVSILENNVDFVVGGATGDDTFGFHTFEEVEAKLFAWNETYPGLVDLSVAGRSIEGNPVYHVVVTDEAVPPDEKVAPMFEGGIHGNEYGGSELFLYVVDTLLENHATNATVRQLLRDVEVHVLPVVNPDGYIAGTRANAMGVNLNRNWDIDWGNPAGASNPVMGQAGDALGRPFGGVAVVAENCGAAPFSEPETKAARDVFLALGDRAAFHLAGHTPTNAVITVPAAQDPPFTVPSAHQGVLDAELQWVRDNTEYEAGRAQWGDLSAGLPYAASGSSMDYFYDQLRKPAFTIEVEYFPTAATSEDYPMRLAQEYEGLRFWMEASVGFPLHLLGNAQALAAWTLPMDTALTDHWTAPKVPQRAPTMVDLLYQH